MAVLVYAIALAGISKPTPNTSYIPILMHVCFIFGASACGLLLLILVNKATSGGNGSNKNRVSDLI
jgi:hypothetical protein